MPIKIYPFGSCEREDTYSELRSRAKYQTLLLGICDTGIVIHEAVGEIGGLEEIPILEQRHED
jgi:hypothetical protein